MRVYLQAERKIPERAQSPKLRHTAQGNGETVGPAAGPVNEGGESIAGACGSLESVLAAPR